MVSPVPLAPAPLAESALSNCTVFLAVGEDLFVGVSLFNGLGLFWKKKKKNNSDLCYAAFHGKPAGLASVVFAVRLKPRPPGVAWGWDMGKGPRLMGAPGMSARGSGGKV